jgi:hypothetical protein
MLLHTSEDLGRVKEGALMVLPRVTGLSQEMDQELRPHWSQIDQFLLEELYHSS